MINVQLWMYLDFRRLELEGYWNAWKWCVKSSGRQLWPTGNENFNTASLTIFIDTDGCRICASSSTPSTSLGPGKLKQEWSHMYTSLLSTAGMDQNSGMRPRISTCRHIPDDRLHYNLDQLKNSSTKQEEKFRCKLRYFHILTIDLQCSITCHLQFFNFR